MNIIQKLKTKYKIRKGKYFFLSYSASDIEEEKYKYDLGGGSENWDQRGLFQLELLRRLGLSPTSKVLDIGCGPGRGSVHLIHFLNQNRYFGTDYNKQYIGIAKQAVLEQKLNGKNPTLWSSSRFKYTHLGEPVDYVLLFSVLNHCNASQRSKFFSGVAKAIHSETKVIISHSSWMKSYKLPEGFKVIDKLEPSFIDSTQYGWSNGDSIFPIYILQKVD